MSHSNFWQERRLSLFKDRVFQHLFDHWTHLLYPPGGAGPLRKIDYTVFNLVVDDLIKAHHDLRQVTDEDIDFAIINLP